MLINGIAELKSLNVNEYTEKKGGLTYLSWSQAWSAFLKVFPNAKYSIEKNEQRIPYFGDSNTGYMCYTTVTAGDITHEMWLPVMDFRNKAILNPNMFDINKTLMRCLTKNLAMFGLGLYIYSGEDLPEETEEVKQQKEVNKGLKDTIWELLQNENISADSRKSYIDRIKKDKSSLSKAMIIEIETEISGQNHKEKI